MDQIKDVYLTKGERPNPRVCDTCLWLNRVKKKFKQETNIASIAEQWVTSSEFHYKKFHYVRI